jgi:hypothetical protein
MPPNKARHDFYEQTVHEKLSNNDEWNLRQIAYNAPKVTVKDPSQAVVELATISNSYRNELDKTMVEFPLGGIIVMDEEKMKQITQELVRLTAGYVKGLLEYYDKKAYGIGV